MKHVQSLATDESDFPALPQEFLTSLEHPLPSKRATKSSISSCASTTPIPFQLADAQQRVIKMSDRERFNLVDEKAVLLPDTCPPCSKCGNEAWSEEVCFSKESKIMTFNQLIPTRGMLIHSCCKNKYYCFYCYQVFIRKCQTDRCEGKLVVDGHSRCLLNMNTFFVTYEVLRSFMFHFLLGRYYEKIN